MVSVDVPSERHTNVTIGSINVRTSYVETAAEDGYSSSVPLPSPFGYLENYHNYLVLYSFPIDRACRQGHRSVDRVVWECSISNQAGKYAMCSVCHLRDRTNIIIIAIVQSNSRAYNRFVSGNLLLQI